MIPPCLMNAAGANGPAGWRDSGFSSVIVAISRLPRAQLALRALTSRGAAPPPAISAAYRHSLLAESLAILNER